MIDFLPVELIILLVSALPIVELRGAIPFALGVYNLSPLSAFFWSIIGNIIPVIFILPLLGIVSNFLSKHSKFFKKFFIWLFERTRKKHNHKFELWGSLMLVLFVAIPLPMTGAWTGALAAFVFGIPFRKALPLIFLGIIIAGVIVSLMSLGILSI